MSEFVQEFYQNYVELMHHLSDTRQISLQVWASDNFRRVLVLVIANHLENEVKDLLEEFALKKSGSQMLSSFLLSAIDRQYSNYFEWEHWQKGNANKFFSHFGKDFRNEAEAEIKNKEELKDGVKAFLEIGNARNILVHERLHQADIGEKTPEDFYLLFKKAIIFVHFLKVRLHDRIVYF
jgi:hypothetical protein